VVNREQRESSGFIEVKESVHQNLCPIEDHEERLQKQSPSQKQCLASSALTFLPPCFIPNVHQKVGPSPVFPQSAPSLAALDVPQTYSVSQPERPRKESL
jgi:hypothetical protein